MEKAKLTRAEVETLLGATPPDDPVAAENVERINRALAGALVEFRAEVARVRITAADLIDLGVGDIITTNQRADRPLAVDVAGHAQFQVRMGTHEGRKAVRVEES
jgi:flagellar motor switch protein FliM